MTPEAPQQEGSRFTGAIHRAQQEARIRSSHVGLPAHKSNALPKSGIQPDASGKVLCPFCHKAYPFSGALLNRQLRCSGCRSTFQVAEDRRSFKIQAAASAPTAEVGSKTKLARAAIRTANTSLNDAAAAAMRALGKQDRPAPPGSETAMRAAVRPSSGTVTRSIKRGNKQAALTGEGLKEGKSRQKRLVVVAGLMLIAALTTWAMQPDDRSVALREFQFRQSLPTLAEAMRNNAFRGRIEPLVDIDHARLETPVSINLSQLQSALKDLAILKRQCAWVDKARLGEATSLLGEMNLEDPTILKAYVARCSKVGIRVRVWDDIVAASEDGQPSAVLGIMTAILKSPPPRDKGFDPLALIEAGHLPESIRVCGFAGNEGSLLRSSGAATRPVAFRGRMLRFHGDGWPATWMVFELGTARQP